MDSLTKVQAEGVFWRGGAGTCVLSEEIYLGVGTNGIQSCKAMLINATNDTFFSITKYASIPVYFMSAPRTAINGTRPDYSCSGQTCLNILRYVHLYFYSNGSLVPSLSYAMIGNTTYSDGYMDIKYEYSFLGSD